MLNPASKQTENRKAIKEPEDVQKIDINTSLAELSKVLKIAETNKIIFIENLPSPTIFGEDWHKPYILPIPIRSYNLKSIHNDINNILPNNAGIYVLDLMENNSILIYVHKHNNKLLYIELPKNKYFYDNTRFNKDIAINHEFIKELIENNQNLQIDYIIGKKR
jgi:hypothetical protein